MPSGHECQEAFKHVSLSHWHQKMPPPTCRPPDVPTGGIQKLSDLDVWRAPVAAGVHAMSSDKVSRDIVVIYKSTSSQILIQGKIEM